MRGNLALSFFEGFAGCDRLPLVAVSDAQLDRLAAAHDVLALYLFGSPADEGRALLEGRSVAATGSDLDIGVVFRSAAFDHHRLGSLQVALEDRFAPLRVDLVPLQRVDALLQYSAIDGHRITATDSTAADFYELAVMRRAAELLPIERELQARLFGQAAQP